MVGNLFVLRYARQHALARVLLIAHLLTFESHAFAKGAKGVGQLAGPQPA